MSAASFPAQIPDREVNLVACRLCGLVKTYGQFYDQGCENCEALAMQADPVRVDGCTTGSFNGMISTMDPERSWAAKWCQIGVYCLSVDEDLPYEFKEELEGQRFPLRLRPDNFYPAIE